MVIVRSRIEWLNLAGYKGYAINPFIGCANACKYCWARRMKRIPYEDWQKPQLARSFQGTTIASVIATELPKNERANVLLSASTDLFQPDYFGYDGIIEEILRGLAWVSDREVHPNIFILTKNAEFLRWQDELRDIKAKIGITLTSIETNEWEPYASEPWTRALALKMAKQEGLFTFVSIEPWIPNVTSPLEIIGYTREFVDAYIIGSLNYFKVEEEFYTSEVQRIINQLRFISKPYFLKHELKRQCRFSAEEMEELSYAAEDFQTVFYQS